MGRRATPGANATLGFTVLVVALGLIQQCQGTVSPDTYEFEEEVYQVVEGTDLTAVVYVTRTGPHEVTDSSVVVQTSDGTAVAGTDYIATTTTVDFQISNDRVAVSVTILDNDDAEDEPELTNCFTLTLMSPDPSDGVLGGDTQVCIIDNDNFFGGTCPPPEAMIEANGEAVIETTVDSSSDTVAISWTEPTLDDPSANMVYRCRPIGMSPGFECDNGQEFPITYTFTASDYNRRIEVEYETIQFGPVVTNDCKFYLRVLDPIPPEITCPADVVAAAGDGFMDGTANWIEPVATDNSGEVSMNSFDPPVTLDIGTHVFTYTAEDSSGNMASCSFNVTITDLTAPEIECPMDIITDTDPGDSFATVMWYSPNVTDNSGESPEPLLSENSGDTFEIGRYTVYVTATDSHDNTGNCSFTIEVQDNEDPIITCPPNDTVTTDPGQDYATLLLPDVDSVSDNSGIVTVTINYDWVIYNVSDNVELDLARGVHLLHYIATDDSMNSATCDVYITVDDQEAPSITCPADVMNFTDPGQPTGIASWPEATVSDNSMNAITPTANATSGDLFEIGDTIVEFEATDDSGNTATCTFTVTIEDDENPVIECPMNIEVEADPGQNFATVTWYMPNVTDNSDESIMPILSQDSGTTFPLGIVTTVFVDASDSSGNQGTCDFTVTVIDDEDPIIMCPPNDTTSTDPGQDYATVSLPNAASVSDNSGMFTITIDVSGMEYDVSDNVQLDLATGLHLLQYTASDSSLNTAMCDVYITVNDTENPNIMCPSDVTNGTEAGLATGVAFWELATVTDNSMVPIIPVADETSGSSFDIGTHTVQFNATDESGNSASCTFTVTIEDRENPEFEACPDLTFSTSPGLPTTRVTYSLPNATDNSGVVMNVNCFGVDHDGQVLGIGVYTVNCLAEDPAELRDDCQFTITVEDNESPNITCPDNLTVTTDVGQNYDTFELPPESLSEDNSRLPVTITIDVDGTTYSIGQDVQLNLADSPHLLQYNATDNSSNVATCDMYVTVNDEEDPVIVCPPDLSNTTNPGEATGNAWWPEATVIDNSMIPITPTANATSGDLFEIGDTIVEFEAMDDSGNTATCTFTVTIRDDENPVIECPMNIEVEADPGENFAIVTWYMPNVTDNSDESIMPTLSQDSGTMFPLGIVTTVFVDASDSSGNQGTCDFTVTVIDDEIPIIMCPPNDTTPTDPGQDYATVSLPNAASVFDNSGMFTITIDVNGMEYNVSDDVQLDLATGLHLLQYTASDSSMNAAMCNVYITVNDTENPNIMCPSDVTNGTEAGLETGVAFWESATVTDNSMLPIMPMADEMSGSSFEIGTHTVQFNATDESGNSNSCTFTVTIEDRENPEFEACPDLTFFTSPGLPTTRVTYSLPNATDNSGVVMNVNCFGVEHDGQVLGIGVYTVNCLAEDPAELRDDCQFTITVEDNESPNITCPDNLTVTTDVGQNYDTFSLPPESLSEDNSRLPVTITIDVDGTTYSIGQDVQLNLADSPHLLQYNATDNSSNVATCDMYVTVNDEEDPVIVCPPDLSNTTNPGEATGNAWWPEATVSDNSMIPITPTANATSGAAFEIGDTIVEFEAMDDSGNTATCTFTVTIQDDENPVIECPMNIEVEADPGENFATVTWYMPNVTDNSDESIMPTLSQDSGTMFPLGIVTTVFVDASDSSGNQGTCDFTVTVIDDEIPIIMCPPNDTTPTDPGQDYATVTLPNAVSVSDNSGMFTITIDVNGMEYNVSDDVQLDLATGLHLLQYTASDSSMNAAMCNVYITVNDTENPNIMCPSDVTNGTEAGLETGVAFWESATVTDNSMLPITPVANETSGSSFVIGTHTVQFNATDESGNSASCTFTVTIEDRENPEFEACPDLTFFTSPGLPTTRVTYSLPNATDNSGVVMNVNCFGVEHDGQVLGIGVYTVNCLAEDPAELRDDCQFTITVEDNESPNITCPDNLTVTTDAGQNYDTFSLPPESLSEDNSRLPVTITIDVDGTTYSIGQDVQLNLADSPHLLQYNATDNSSNVATCDMYVTVNDEEDPVIVCPPDLSNTTNPGEATGNVWWPEATVSDNSMIPITPMANETSGAAFEIGDTIVEFEAMDDSGNTATCTFTVTIDDDENPVIECPMNIEVETDPGENFATVTWYMPNVTDNSDESIMPTLSQDSGTTFPLGIVTTVFVDASDSSGNQGTCDFTVTVIDDEDPIIMCPPNGTTPTDPGQNYATVSLPNATSVSDNSGMFTITIDVNGMEYDVSDDVQLDLATGLHLLLHTASDSFTNNASCDSYITVSDTEDPVLVCPEDQMLVVPDGQLSATVTWSPPQVTDNSGNVPEALSTHVNGSDFPIGEEVIIVYNATDDAGNIGYCNFTILVIDNVPPEIICPNNLTEPTNFNRSYATVTWSDPTLDDNVPSSVTFVSDLTNGGDFELSVTPVTLTATDAAGNNATCQFTITVVDMEAPVIYGCPAGFSTNTTLGEAYGEPVFSEPTAQDNSGSVDIAGLGRSGDQFPIGPNEIVYVAIDEAGNTAICRVNILVIDNENPELAPSSQCPADIELFIQDEDSDNITVTWTDPVFQDNSGTIESVTVDPLPNNSPFPEDNTTVTIVAMDPSGNTFECEFVVTVNMYDMTPPVFSECPPSFSTVYTDPGLSTASPFDFSITVSDSGSGVQSSVLSTNEPFEIGNNSVSLSAVDFAGNVAYCNFTVTVYDNEAPNITSCPDNQTVNTEMDSPYGHPTWTTPTATDNSGEVTVSCTMQSGDDFDIGDTTVECTATDPSNNTDMCSFVITVIDEQPPDVTFCPDDIDQGTDPGVATAVVTFGQPTATDNDGIPLVPVASHQNNSVFQLGDTDVSFAFTDSSGNVAYCNFTITVTDDEPPTAGDTCPNDTLVFTPMGNATAPAQWVPPTLTDNVGIVNEASTHVPGDEFPIGTTPVIYTATDAAGLTGGCEFTVEVQDTEDPVFVLCPLPMRQPTDFRLPYATVDWVVPSVTDNSGIIASLEASNEPGDTFPIGSHTVTYTAVDPDGNIGTCSFAVIVVDEEDPVVENCRANVTLYVPHNSTEIFVTWPFPTVTDNAGPPMVYNATYTETVVVGWGIVIVTVDWLNGYVIATPFHIGCYECVIRVEDEAGNVAECVTQLWIIDLVAPVFDVCPPAHPASYPTDLDSPTAVVSWTPPVATDNTGGAVTEDASHLPGDAFHIGVTTVTIDATDESDNVATCEFNITVVDEQRPNLTCPDSLVLYTDPGSDVSTDQWDLPTVFDNSGYYNLTSTADPGDPLSPGPPLRVTYTAVDEAGNQAECSFDVEVRDNEDPFFASCPDSITQQTDPQQSMANMTWPPLLPMDNVGVQEVNSNYQPGDLFPIGDRVVEYNVTDTSGNMGFCSFTVTVEDMEDPTIECPGPVISQDTDPLKSTANVTYEVTASDNSGEWYVSCEPPSGSDFSVSVTNVICTVTDPSDNTDTCSFAVLVSDNEDPVFDSCPNNIILDEPLENFVNFTIVVNWTAPVATDNVGVELFDVTFGPGSVFNIGSFEVVYTAVDAADNVATCEFTVVVNDVQPPVFTGCPTSLLRFPTDPTQNTATVFWDEPGALDNLDMVMPTSSHSPGDEFSVGNATVTYTAVDNSGNSVNCSFVVEVYDDQPPTFINCPIQGVTNDTSPQSDRGVAYWPEPQGTDNVGVASEGSNYQPGDTFPLGPTVVTYNVSDAAGFVAECSFTVLIQDNEAPVLECPEAITVNVFTHQEGAFVDYPRVNATDYASGLDTQMCTIDSGAFFLIGVNDVTCTAEDLANNFNFCIFQVIVEGSPDTEPPVISDCPMNATRAADNGTTTTIISWTPPTVTDNSGDNVTLEVTSDPGSTFSIGVTMVTYTATDAAGLVSTCSFFVIVLDLENPDILQCPMDITQSTDPGVDSAIVDWASPGVIDNSGTVMLTASDLPGEEFYIGTTTVTYTAEDSDGNTEQCSFDITITDDEAPMIEGCPSIQLERETEPGQNYSLVMWDEIMICDNSGNWTVNTTGPSPGRIEVGEHQVTYVAADAAGNTEECSFTVRVRDTELPEFLNCPTEIIKLVNVSGQDAVVTWDPLLISDNVGVDFATLAGNFDSGDTFSFGGPTQVSFMVEDISGNTNFCSFTVTVSDAPLAVSNCPVYIQQPTDPGQDSAVVTWDLPDVEPVGANVDIQSAPYESGQAIPLGTHSITYFIEDFFGNSAMCVFMVEVVDNEPPTWDVCPTEVSVTPPSGADNVSVSWPQPVAQDNSGNVEVSNGSHSIGDLFSLGMTPVSYTASDEAGNTITCSFIVTVADLENPDITCPAASTEFTDPGKGTVTVTWEDAMATDNVDVTLLVSSPPNGSPLSIGPNTITYTAYDAAQNSADCSFTITVIDNEDPVFTDCPSVASAVAPPDQDMAVVVWDLPSASDNAITVTVESFQQSAALYPLGVTPVVYLATDLSGNQANCTFDVIVYDEQTPVFTNCPDDITENTAAGQSVAVGVAWTPPTASDNDPQLAESSNYVPPADFPVGVTEVNYTAVDRAGNSALCEFMVTVNDIESPVYDNCPASVSIPAVPGTTMANVSWTPPMPRDNVGVANSDSTHSPNTVFSFGVTEVVYTASDAAGNIGQCTFSVTILDSNAPMLMNCPPDQTFCADPGTFSRAVSWIEPAASDTEGSVTRDSNFSPGDTFFHNDGTPTPVTYTATDESNLNASCTFYITIEDCENPVITNCPGGFTEPGDFGGGSTTVEWTEPTATDNSGQVLLNRTHSPGDTFTAATSPTFVRYTATDPSGNTDTCVFMVVVTDNTAPLIRNCPSNQTIFTDFNAATGTANWMPPTIDIDEPDNVALVPSHQPGAMFPVGSNPVTYSATDASGNQAVCRFWIIVRDNQLPTITCPDNIVVEVASGVPSTTVSWDPPSAEDNAGTPTVVGNPPPGSGFDVGQDHTVTYTATDDSGNVALCQFTVSVIDAGNTILITCPPNININTAPGEPTNTATWDDPETSSSSPASITLTPSVPSGSVFGVGENTVTYTASDGMGNSATCDFTVTVSDMEPPVFENCPMNITGMPMDTISWTTPTVTDNTVLFDLAVSRPSGSMFSLGVHHVTYTATDNHDNEATCIFSVTIEENNKPSVSNCPSMLTRYIPEGQSQVEVTWDEPTATDADGINRTEQNYYPGQNFSLGAFQITYMFIDNAGFAATCQFVLTVELTPDNTPPVITNCPMDIVETLPEGQIRVGVTWDEPTIVDARGSVSIMVSHQPGDLFSAGTTEVIYEATDGSDNTANCTFNVHVDVVDTVDPVWRGCPGDIEAFVPSGTPSRAVTWTPPTASDSISSVTTMASHSPGAEFDVGVTKVVYTATDVAGNRAYCNFTITITEAIDTEDPIINGCPDEITREVIPGVTELPVSWTPPTAVDNFGTPMLECNFMVGHSFPLGENEVMCTATDGSGNEAVCTFYIIIIAIVDTTPPTISNCPSDITRRVAASVTFVIVAWTPPTATDDLSGVSLTTDHNPSESFPSGRTVVTYTATDGANNVATCMFNVDIINDDTDPVIHNCPMDVGGTLPPGQTQTVASWTPPTATDDSGEEVNLVTTREPNTLFDLGETPVTYTAFDNYGNSAVCSFTVTIVEDEGAPTIMNCPNSINHFVASGVTETPVQWTAPTVLPASASLMTNHEPGSSFTAGASTLVTYTASDDLSRTATCTFTVAVIVDDQEPVIHNCPENIERTVPPGQDSLSVSWTPPVAWDNSGEVDLEASANPGDSFEVQTTTVTYTATDPFGQSAVCTFTVTVTVGTDCDSNPCMNGGTCVPMAVTGFTCECPSTWMGDLCEEDVNECELPAVILECSARGLICFNHLNGYTCGCPIGFFIFGNSNNCRRGTVIRINIVIIEISGTNAVFVAAFSNSNSVIFLTHQRRIQFLLVIVFGNLPGFARVSVLFFSSGSVVAEVAVTFDANSTVTQDDVNNALQEGITAGDLLMGSEYKLSPSESVVIEEVCVDGYCLNGGTCMPDSAYLSSCTCPDGYTGERCETGPACDSNPCMNGGTCGPLAVTGFTCTCPSTWMGVQCEEDVNECNLPAVSQECLGDLICINQLDGYNCDCPDGFVRAGNSNNCRQGRVFRTTIVIIEIFGDDAVFILAFGNPNSVTFLRHQRRLQFLLVIVFRNLPGFGSVSVLFFSSGSVVAEVAVTVDADSPVTQDDVDNALEAGITAGDLLMGSEYKLSPSESVVIEEVCVDGYCLNGGTCTPDSAYLSSCTCPAGYAGERCESMIVTTVPPGDGGLSTEVIVLIAVGSAVALLLILLILGCMCYLMRGSDRQRRGYLYREDFESYPVPKRNPNDSVYDVQFQPRDNYGIRPSASQFSTPFIATGNEGGIPLHQLMDREDADYY